MVRRVGTARTKTKHKLTHYYKNKGKIPLSKYFQEFAVGDKVALVVNPSFPKGRYFPRFHGLIGTVLGKKGFCYQVTLKDGQKEKLFNLHPLHLKKV